MNNIPKQFICPITLTLMSEPYSDSDGNTYEKDAIIEWVNQHHNSPITRNPLTLSSLTPNRALKELIQTFLGNSQNQTQNPQIVEDIGREPIIIIAIADVSGSMNEICSNKNSSEAQNFTRLDLVKHTLNTIVNSLKAQDKLALIKFDNIATAITGIIPVNQTNKDIFIDKIQELQPNGGTNIWDALKCALNLINNNNNNNNKNNNNNNNIDDNIHILLFTDGESNDDPPRGIIQTLKEYINNLKQINNSNYLNFMIHTYGFGNNINSSLLYEISDLNKGIFGFIPDSTMIGTVFINSIAKMMDNRVSNNTCWYDKWSMLNDDICSNFVQALKSKNMTHFKEFSKNIQNNQFLNDIMIDCNDSINDSDGQIYKAFSNKYYDKWGKHYILSVISAYNHKLCLNFRDHGVQHFKTPFFIKFQKEIEDVFINLTPPIPTGNVNIVNNFNNYFNNNANHNVNFGNVRYGGTQNIQFNTSPVSNNHNHPVTPQVFSATFYNSSGVCFTTDSFIKLKGGIFTMVQDVKKGMEIESMGETATVLCVLKTRINGSIRRLMNNPTTGITNYHPIFMEKYNNQWNFPSELMEFFEDYVYDEYVYDYILDRHHIVELDGGVYATTLNHGRKGDVIGHDYFGTEKIVNDLQKHPGWNDGFIQLDNYTFTRNERTNCITGIQF